MKKKHRAAMALVLVVLQLFCFFIPASAAEAAVSGSETEGTWVEESFSNTTIEQDFGEMTPEQLQARFPLDSAKDRQSAEIVSAVTQKGTQEDCIDLYLYVYVPGGTSEFVTGTAAVSAADFTNERALPMACVDFTETLLKVRCSMTSEQYRDYETKDGYRILLDSFWITWRTAGSGEQKYTYDAVTRQLNGGKLGSEILLTVSADGKPTAWTVEETLKLDVHLTSSRYSTPENNEYVQLNTAIFLVPTKYFYDGSGKYLSLEEIVYKAAYYHDVPMLVSETDKFMDFYEDIYCFGEVNSNDGILNFNWTPHYDSSSISQDNTLLNKPAVPICDFVFYASEIIEEAYGGVDVSGQELSSAFRAARESWRAENYGRPFSTYIRAGRYDALQVYTARASDQIKTESYADGASFLTRLHGWRIFGENLDDSIDTKSIQACTLADYQRMFGAGPVNYTGQYELSKEGFSYFSELALQTFGGGSDEYTIVIMHYALTPYRVYDDVDGYRLKSGEYGWIWNMGDSLYSHAYIVFNSIVSDFEVVELHYASEDQMHIVPTVMPTMTFIAGLESEEAKRDETYDPPDISWPEFLKWPKWPDFSGVESLWEMLKAVLRIVFLVVIVTVAVWAVTKVFKLLGAVRDAFGRRGGGKGGRGSG